MSFSQQHYQLVLRMSYPFLFTHHKVFLEIYHLLPCLVSALPYVFIKNHVLYLKDLYRLCSSCVDACAPEQNQNLELGPLENGELDKGYQGNLKNLTGRSESDSAVSSTQY